MHARFTCWATSRSLPPLSGMHFHAQVFNMMTSAVFYMLCMLLVMWPAPEDSAFTRAKHALRIPLHVVSYCIATSLFIHHIKLPGMAVCSPFVSEYSALEALAAYLLWPASYPMMAALPLALAVPLQLATFVGLYFANEPECAMGAPICPKTDDQYHLFNKVASVIGAGLPVSLPMASELTDDVTCHNIMTHLKLGISVIISFYVTYYAEISTRKAYALQVGRLRLADELQLRKQQVWQLCGELAVALILAWHLCVFSQQVPALMAGIFS